nr:hypothetical protein [Tanacetum cinerariifolium]
MLLIHLFNVYTVYDLEAACKMFGGMSQEIKEQRQLHTTSRGSNSRSTTITAITTNIHNTILDVNLFCKLGEQA